MLRNEYAGSEQLGTDGGSNERSDNGTTRRDSQGSELLMRAHHLRALVLHSMAVLAQLQCEAGSLGAMASLADCVDEP